MHTDSNSGETSTHALSASSPSIVPHCGDIPTTFFGALKIIRLLNKRGFSFRWLRLVSCRWRWCAGEIPVSQSRVPWWKGVGHASDTRIGGEIFTDYYFGEENTANNTDNQTIPTENNFFFAKTGLLQYNTTNKGS